MKKAVLAGGTGFIGSYLENELSRLGYEVIIISRQKQHVSWQDRDNIIQALEGAEMLINLAGKSVNCRYNERNKQEIFDSRTETTQILGEAVLACAKPPVLWLNSSTATIYRHAQDRPMTEQSGEIGSGFSVEVAKKWEETFFQFQLPYTRQAALRISIVLGPGGGVMTPMQNLVRFGLGGHQGPGDQMFSWIHIEDVLGIILFLRDREDLSGVFNCASPQPVTNRELMAQLRSILHRPVGLPSPKWMLEMGAVFIKTETELVLKSRWVIPERLQQEGYHFKHDKLREALQHIVQADRSR
nr:TIGR01777 family oxidoreductase [Paenibacillus lemnae]